MTKEIKAQLEKAQRDLSNLEAQHDLLLSEAAVLRQRRDAIALDAHTGSKSAMDELTENIAKDAANNVLLASLEAALTGARSNLNKAKAAEATAADKAKAEQLRAVVKEFVELGENIDLAFADIHGSLNDMQKLLDRIHQLGLQLPNRTTIQRFRSHSISNVADEYTVLV
jgi:hypothetical protein